MSRKQFDKVKDNIESNFNGTKRNPNRKSRRNHSKGNRDYNQETKKSTYDRKSLDEASNNPQLYKRFPELMRWASQIPVNVISNLPAPLGKNSLTLPNIVVLTLNLISPCTPNSSDERNTNMIQLSNDLYAKIREYNSGAKNYDPPALVRLIFAMAGVFQRINFLQRIYGLINHTSAYNRAFPQMLFRAMHLDYESFRDDQTNFAARLDTIIVRAKDIKLISDIPILERIGMMYANYYIDTDDARDTLYIPMPGLKGFLDLDANENLIFSDGGMSYISGSFVDKSSDLITADTLLKNTERYLNKVLTSQDFGIMQGDIVHAFPNASLTTLNPLPDSLDLGPINDKAMLMQYHNADIINDNDSYWKVNDNNFLSFDSKGLPIGNYLLPTTSNNPYHGNAHTVGVNATTGNVPAAMNNNRFFEDYAFMCLDSDTVDPDWFLEVTRMKIGAGVDVIEGINVYLAMDTNILNEITADYTYSPTAQDVYNLYGEFPYTKHLIRWNGKKQKSVRLVRIQDVGTQSVWNTNGISQTSQYWFYDANITDIGDISAANQLRSICRYLPYSVTLIKPFKDVASGSTIIVKDYGHYHVNTFCPIVQPVPKATMDMLSFICWKSLLSFPR